ncbi:cytochrome c oxidase subunit 3 [Pseudaminobacter sp. NGMCC 1.201702]|uniref:cytochrome c oxidase subunit 3 n=1 Tax=Pseudaminobacter sp. NGMCC 1.201702 TaxID=3391825 RepID=UPI0039EEA2F1
MSVIVVFLLVLAGVAGWWLAQQRLMSKPWLEHGPSNAFPGTEAPDLPAEKIGLGVFLAVVGCLFALFASAYFIRMGLPDWQAMPVPPLLWLNTGMLVLSSVALHLAVVAIRRDQLGTARLALGTGGLTALAFLAGQLTVWRDLTTDGYFLSGNPANSFFYLITGMHGLHILGGLVALGRTTARAWNVEEAGRLQLSIELCATYWHFLLFIWLAIFVLLAGWANALIDICRQLLT